MKIIRYAYLLLLMLLTTGCNWGFSSNYDERFGYTNKYGTMDSIPEIVVNQNNIKTIVVPKDISKKSIRDTIFDSVRYVQLETTEKCLIGQIDEVFIVDNKIIIVDKSKQEKVFIFSKTGKFITQVGDKGKGPGEYTAIDALAIDHKNKQIVIIDNSLLKWFYYDLSGNLIKYKKSFYWVSDMVILNNGHFVMRQYYNNNRHLPEIKEYQIIIADTSRQIIGKLLSYNHPKYDPNIRIYNPRSFNISGKKLLFNPLYTNDIYEFNKSKKPRLKYKIDLGKMDILNNLMDYKTHKDRNMAKNQDRLWSMSGIALEAGNYLYIKISNGGHLFYNMVSDNMIYGNSISSTPLFKKDTKKLPKILISFYSTLSTGNEFVSVIYPSRNRNDFRNGKTTVEYQNLPKPVNIYDNPILGFYTLKEK